MPLQLTVLVVPLVVSAVVTIGVVLYAVRHGRRYGFDKTTLSFISILGFATIWTVARLIQYSVSIVALKHAAIVGAYIGFGGTVVAVLCFALAFSGREDLVTVRNLVLFAFVPLIAVVLTATNRLHGLAWTEQVITIGNLVFLDREFRAPLQILWAYNLTCVLIGVVLLLREAIDSPDLYRGQLMALVVGTAAPAGLGLLFLFDAYPGRLPAFVELTTAGFAITGVLYGYAIFRYQLLEIVPVARETVFDNINEAVFILDERRLVTDANDAALALCDLEAMPVGDRLNNVLSDRRQLLKAIETASAASDGGETTALATDSASFPGGNMADAANAVDVTVDDQHLAVSTSPLHNTTGDTIGTVVRISDITERRKREQELEQREQEIELLNDVYSRILRHNLRNDLTVIKTTAQLLPELDQEQTEEYADTIVEKSEELNRIADTARLIGKVVHELEAGAQLDANEIARRRAQDARNEFPHARITATCNAENGSVVAHEGLYLAVENLIENGVIHNDGDPVVEVTVERDGDTVRLSVTDNGPGIPDDEIAVLQQYEETDLSHGSGAGLWLVNWIVRKSDGDLEFQREGNHSTVTLLLEGS